MVRINPEFIYSSLEVISRQALDDPKKAKTTVIDFTKHLRTRLDSIAFRELIFFETEIKNVEGYLRFESERLSRRLHVNYSLDVMGFLIPALTLQSLVEDLVSFREEQGIEGDGISICSKLEKKHVRIELSDKARTEIYADENSKKRLELIRQGISAGQGGELWLERNTDGASKIVILLPAHLREGAHNV